MNDAWRWDYAWDVFPDVLDGIGVTVQATVLGSLLAYALGLPLALLRRSDARVVRGAAWLFIEFIRSTPLAVQLFLLFFVLPEYGVTLSPMTTAVVGLGVHYACYTAEIYRAGIEAVPAGQWEAAAALSLPRRRVWAAVILPQAVPRVVPALGNCTISMLKETPILLLIGVLDIVGSAYEAGSASFRYVEPITIAGLLFLALSYPCALVIRYLERRFEPAR